MQAELTRAEMRRSDLWPYCRQLRRLGFHRADKWTKDYRVNKCPWVFQRSYWRFRKRGQKVLLKISRHGYELIIWRQRRERLRIKTVCWSHLQQPFNEYFGGEICLKTLYNQKPVGKSQKKAALKR